MDTLMTEAPPPARVRSRALAVGIGLVVLVLAAAVVLWRLDGRTPEVPYDDPQAGGSITLCSADGKAVTGGKVADRPFAAIALGESGVPTDLDPQGAVGTLFAYQPREGVGIEEFSGTPLTAATVLGDPERPAVTVTEDVWSVGDFVTAFPATWDGFVQLRIYLGTPGAGTLTDRPYDTADIRVDGDSWELVDGGDASCAGAGS